MSHPVTKVKPSTNPGDKKVGETETIGEDEWIVMANKTGRHRWVNLHTKKTAESYFRCLPDYKPPKFLKTPFLKKWTKVRATLRRHKIFCLAIGWDNVWDIIDDAWDDATATVAKRMNVPNHDVISQFSLLFFTDFQFYWALRSGQLNLQHAILEHDKPVVISAFKKVFGSKFKWTGSEFETLRIKL